jgi:hypothetical protein
VRESHVFYFFEYQKNDEIEIEFFSVSLKIHLNFSDKKSKCVLLALFDGNCLGVCVVNINIHRLVFK